MEEQVELMTVDNIYNQVYVIRGQQVMLDSDIALIYGYEVKRLNQQVKRNIARFYVSVEWKWIKRIAVAKCDRKYKQYEPYVALRFHFVQFTVEKILVEIYDKM